MSSKNNTTSKDVSNLRRAGIGAGVGAAIALAAIFYFNSPASEQRPTALQAAQDLGSALEAKMNDQHPSANFATFKRNDVFSAELSDEMAEKERSLTEIDLSRVRSVTDLEIEVIGENIIGDNILRVKAVVNGSEKEFITTDLYGELPRGLAMKRTPSDPSKWEVRTDGSEYERKPSAWLYMKLARVVDFAVHKATSEQEIKDAWEKENLRVNASKTDIGA
ncbi:hypothetical protein RYA05_01460 [Pseudomonas syringae pv. actinidiae]|nr:hypothetical protein [Pseudomonas syringae pv. actinidiae]